MTAAKRPSVRFFDQEFLAVSREDSLQLVHAASAERLSFLVTPNVNDIVQRFSRATPAVARAWDAAHLRICDSKVLAFLARLVKKRLLVYPGSDLVHDLLNDQLFDGVTIGVAGPTRIGFQRLTEKYPHRSLKFIDVPYPLNPDGPAWGGVRDAIAKTHWDVLLLCISYPKQQLLAHQLCLSCERNGIMLCVGAAVDFQTGAQKRAPRALRRAGVEWLYRLCTNPTRLWKRYLLDGPKIFPLFVRIEMRKSHRANPVDS